MFPQCILRELSQSIIKKEHYLFYQKYANTINVSESGAKAKKNAPKERTHNLGNKITLILMGTS